MLVLYVPVLDKPCVTSTLYLKCNVSINSFIVSIYYNDMQKKQACAIYARVDGIKKKGQKNVMTDNQTT